MVDVKKHTKGIVDKTKENTPIPTPTRYLLRKDSYVLVATDSTVPENNGRIKIN